MNALKCFMNLGINNLIKFINLRDHDHAQWEIQRVAKACAEIAKDLWPVAMTPLKIPKLFRHCN